MNRIYLFCWNRASESGRALAEALDIKRIKYDNSKFRGSPDKTVINWGATKLPDEMATARILNTPEALKKNVSKLEFFQRMREAGVSIPEFTEDPDLALEWVKKGETVCCRTILNGHSGAGLVIAHRTHPDNFVKAPLYTIYKKKKDEYRVHVAFGEIIDVQRKALRKIDDEGLPIDRTKANFLVRNLENGFVFVRNELIPPDCVYDVAEQSFKESGLHFGAFDIIYNEQEKKAYVLEVNSAPGLCGTTLESYKRAFKEYLQ